ncbi:hypothetical protein EXN66_Car002108 [Channa argus]|uniref:Uncharacterized protein n=1 Tax=Channa argus TaxID=215402 RepID=A0A6G1P8R8_CHAAH|nr:hypothetical protein EXN66_Car002108 [Channa argus]
MGGGVRRLLGSSFNTKRKKFPLIDFKCDFPVHNCGFEGLINPSETSGDFPNAHEITFP